jgi:predicted TIM-barrel fold metal-dependent hydrolase
MSRRGFITTASLAAIVPALPQAARGQTPAPAPAARTSGAAPPGTVTHPLIDIHMHQAPDNRRGTEAAPRNADAGRARQGGASAGRTEAQFLAHQKNINAVGTVILGANDHQYGFIDKDPSSYVRFASAGSDGDDRRAVIKRALESGARGIGELRYEGETAFTTAVVELARDFGVPILFHFQEANNAKAVYANFYRYIEKYPTVKFIGHAIDWWGAIDKNYSLAGGTYPRGRVTRGGLTDVWLARYPNLHADLSATSGNTALLRDPDFAKNFVNRHQDKLMFGSDCPCPSGNVATCWSVIKLVALNQLDLSDAVKQKIYLGNAQKLLGLKVG